MIIKREEQDINQHETWTLAVAKDRVFLIYTNDMDDVFKIENDYHVMPISSNPKYVEWLFNHKNAIMSRFRHNYWYKSDEHHDKDYYYKELVRLIDEIKEKAKP